MLDRKYEAASKTMIYATIITPTVGPYGTANMPAYVERKADLIVRLVSAIHESLVTRPYMGTMAEGSRNGAGSEYQVGKVRDNASGQMSEGYHS